MMLEYFDRLSNEIEKTYTYKKNPNVVFWTAGGFNLLDINLELLTIKGNRYPKTVNERALELIFNLTLFRNNK